ncbi:MAG: phosphatase PAP2 family protein [Saprospiraceae bacterium]|nr:phosphatase PAP2 family protein [Saprospiraceae bacterium]MCF8249415.1 phosphatase PAP2 family protein [Saprospiraceae bacterium]MCF8279069.1 phosphatase PAP2 family protein [Bacteroidales bacterium]MCF8311544.1 phosphatase PAP2 family protein [Saprospiraceae bacterium]MCF8440034.1 phosphatase PAP2 family protein [Saprospiraceae bacterium]
MAFERFPRKETTIVLSLEVAYLLWTTLVLGLRTDHLMFVALTLGLFFGTSTTRKLLMSLIFFAIYWVLYDSMRALPNYAVNPVHVQQPYDLEKWLFGFQYHGQRVTPNEFFAINTHPAADVLSGLFYLCWVPVPIGFAFWLFFKDKRMLLDFSLCFLLVNLFGFAMYYAYPAAAPWYVELHGFKENFNIPGNEAGLVNFDRILGVNLFHSMYAKNANVFAAIPSLHAAYPIISLYFGVKMRLQLASWVFLVILLGIWFSAVYSRHHYIIDVLLGLACAGATILVFEKVILKSRVNGWLGRYAVVIK